MNLLSVLLKTLLADKAVAALSKKTGLSSAKLKKLIPLALPLLIKFMTNNASQLSGAQALLGALGQHTDTKAMDLQIAEADETDGGKILGHILGASSGAAINGLAQESGLKDEDVTKALSGIAPAMLSTLSGLTASGKVDLSDGLDLSDIMGLLGGAQVSTGASKPAGSLLGSILGGNPGGILGGLLGGGKDESAADGTALLQALLAAKK